MEEKKDIAAQWEMWQVDLVHLPDQNDVFSMDTHPECAYNNNFYIIQSIFFFFSKCSFFKMTLFPRTYMYL